MTQPYTPAEQATELTHATHTPDITANTDTVSMTARINQATLPQTLTKKPNKPVKVSL